MLPYADLRAYSDRLNDLFIPAGWSRKCIRRLWQASWSSLTSLNRHTGLHYGFRAPRPLWLLFHSARWGIRHSLLGRMTGKKVRWSAHFKVAIGIVLG